MNLRYTDTVKKMRRYNRHKQLWKYKKKLERDYNVCPRNYYHSQIEAIKDHYGNIIGYKETHHSKSNKDLKRACNKYLRKQSDIPSGNAYKKYGSEQYNILFDW